ncbi:MAG: AMP-binding protein [Bradymonadaceae bacterium]|nr:AMP-binding protein [Lujinxingiaceae bacterium]
MLVDQTLLKKTSGRRPEPGHHSLFAMFEHTARAQPTRGMYMLDERGGQEFRSYAQVLEGALRVGAALRDSGLVAGDRLFLSQRTSFEFLTSLFGAMAIGVLPIPLPMPRAETAGNVISVAARWARLSRRLDAHAVLFSSSVDAALRPKTIPSSVFHLVTDLPTLLERAPASPTLEALRPGANDVAYIQLTSGTTTARRGVMLTHRNILENVDAVGAMLAVNSEDVVVSWLPLDNIMGLVAVVFFSIYWGVDVVLMEPERFLKHPADWFWALSNHRGSLTLAPNFAYHYGVRRCKESDLEGLDLSRWRIAMNGSEPVRAQHMEAFARRFRPYGLRDNVFVPVYGLSEATLAVSICEPQKPLIIDGINRAVLERDAVARPLPPEGAPSPAERMHCVSIGRPVEGIEVQIRDDTGQAMAERVCGEIVLRGANVMAGYVQATINAEDSRQGLTRLIDGWLYTGDVGYLADGNLFFVGRRCEAIITASGRQIFPDEVELFVNSVDGVRSGTATIFDIPHQHQKLKVALAGAALVIAYETQSGVDSAEVEVPLRALLKRHLDLEPDVLIALSPRSIPKTRSGKVRRFLARQLYLDNKLDRRYRNALDLVTVVRGLRKVRREATLSTKTALERLEALVRRRFDGD